MTSQAEESLLTQARCGLSQREWMEPDGLTPAERGGVTLAWVHADTIRSYRCRHCEGAARAAQGWWEDDLARAVADGASLRFLNELFGVLLSNRTSTRKAG